MNYLMPCCDNSLCYTEEKIMTLQTKEYEADKTLQT